MLQAGYLFPGTSWEIAARYSAYTVDLDGLGGLTFVDVGATEIAGAVTYYIDGHSDKVTLDAAMISADDAVALKAPARGGCAGMAPGIFEDVVA